MKRILLAVVMAMAVPSLAMAGDPVQWQESGNSSTRSTVRSTSPLPVTLYPPSVGSITSTTTCQNVSTTAVTVQAANTNRVAYSLWTTSGAATIYWRVGGTAVAEATGSGSLDDALSYTEDVTGTVATAAISAITKSGTTWVCVKENSR